MSMHMHIHSPRHASITIHESIHMSIHMSIHRPTAPLTSSRHSLRRRLSIPSHILVFTTNARTETSTACQQCFFFGQLLFRQCRRSGACHAQLHTCGMATLQRLVSRRSEMHMSMHMPIHMSLHMSRHMPIRMLHYTPVCTHISPFHDQQKRQG